MKQFFLKKYCFAAIFLGFLFGFSALNLLYGAEEWKELGEELCQVEDISMLEVWTRDAEQEAGEEILGRIGFVEAYGSLQKILGKREFNRFSYIRDDDGMLYYGALMDSDNSDLEEYAANVRRMKEAVEQNGARFLVVVPPSKVLYGVSNVNREWPINDPNARTDKFLNLMMENGVTAVDMRQAMQRSGRGLDELFFKTDHHWTPLAALLGVKELTGQVSKLYGDDWDPDGYYTDLSNYHSQVYQQGMLGSSGRNTGIAYAGLDDYTLLWPECDMTFTWEDYEHDTSKTGSFTEALLDEKKLTPENLYEGSMNMVYLDEVVRRDRIINHSNPDGPKLTVLRDSYFSPMACFLAPMCSEIDMMWGRRSRNDMDFETFIRESEADYVILEIYPYDLTKESFDFFQTVKKQGGGT